MPWRQTQFRAAQGPSPSSIIFRASSYRPTRRSGTKRAFTGTVRICFVFAPSRVVAKPSRAYCSKSCCSSFVRRSTCASYIPITRGARE